MTRWRLETHLLIASAGFDPGGHDFLELVVVAQLLLSRGELLSELADVSSKILFALSDLLEDSYAGLLKLQGRMVLYRRINEV